MTTTKAQERKALEQIRKIVAELGEDSYVGTAFEGCFEIAEDNIQNDFANSMKASLNYVLRQKKEIEEEYMKTREQNRDLEDDLKKTQVNLEATKATMQDWINGYNKTMQMYGEQVDKTDALQKQVEVKDLEIIKLKAKLYDYMTDAR